MSGEYTDCLPDPPIGEIGGLQTFVATPAEGRPMRDGWPGLIFLHGRGECANRKTMSQAFLENGSAHGPLRRVNPDHERCLRDRFVIATPQLPENGGNVWHEHGDAVRDLVAALVQQHGVDTERLSLCGFSFGGNGVVSLADLHPWHALWAVDPPMEPPAGLATANIWRFAFGAGATRNRDAWLAVLPVNRRVIVEYGEEHGLASWRDFANPASYEGLT
jgi:hypothetical protein